MLIKYALMFYACMTFSSMAGMSISAGICGTILILTWLQKRQQHPQSTDTKNFLLMSLLLIGTCYLSLLQASLWPLYYAGKTFTVQPSDFVKGWHFFFPALVFWSIEQLQPREKKQLFQTYLLAATAVSIAGLVQIFFGFAGASANPSLPHLYQTTLFFHHHLSTASILIFPFFIGLSLFFQTKGLLFFMTTITTGLVLFFTWSRTLWVAAPIGILLCASRYLPIKKMVAAIASLIVCGSALLMHPAVWSRITHSTGKMDRWLLWKANWEFFLARPWLGIGWRKPEFLTAAYFQERYPDHYSSLFVGNAHNMIMENLGGIGLIGTVVWALWCGFIWKIAYQKKQDAIQWGVLCAWVVFLLNGLTQVNFWEGKSLHQLMWSVSLLLLTKPSEDLRHSSGYALVKEWKKLGSKTTSPSGRSGKSLA